MIHIRKLEVLLIFNKVSPCRVPSSVCNYAEGTSKLNLKALTDETKKMIKNEQNITKEKQHKQTITQLGAKDKHLK